MTPERTIIRDMPLQQAVEEGVIDNQTLAYFMARTYQFLINVGINPEAIRFRQHRCDEMAITLQTAGTQSSKSQNLLLLG